MESYIENLDALCKCPVCRHHHDVTIPRGLIEDFMRGDVVIFAGAGVSTENSVVLKSTFYDDISSIIGKENSNLPFPEIMGIYAKQHNGRLKLLSELKRRFKHIDSFPDLRNNATRFHKELATFYPVETVITTNWDRYFEEDCGATAFINSEDLAFWGAPGRKVIKIHGSIDNFGSGSRGQST